MSLSEVLTRIEQAAARRGRSFAEITVVAVGKTQPPEVLREAYRLGVRDFGENRAAELADKAKALPADVRWHFVGHLQRNKVHIVRPLVTLLHSMDGVALGEAWLKGPGRPPPVLLEVNIGEEPQKHGVAPEATMEVAAVLVDLRVDLRGLMAVPPWFDDPERTRPYFRRLALLRDELSLRFPAIRELSMGMSDDFEVAIEEGATMLRLGRAIFGPRREP